MIEDNRERTPESSILKEDVRSYNVGQSDYAKHRIQPWDIWLEYKLNPWDADIVKREPKISGVFFLSAMLNNPLYYRLIS